MERQATSPALPLDPGPADGTGGPRIPSDPGRRRTPGLISGPRFTPPARKVSRPPAPAAEGPAVEPARRADTGPRRLPPARTEKKPRTGLIIGVSALTVGSLGLGGLLASVIL